MAEEGIDGFLGGRLRLRQGARGHRAGADAMLLASATPLALDGLLLDAGAGAGAVGLSAALLAPKARVGLIEVAPELCALARQNVALNGFEARVTVFEANLLDAALRRAAGLPNGTAQAVLTNPPYLRPGRDRVSPDALKVLAHVEAAPLSDWIAACFALLAPGGFFAMIQRADALGRCLAALEARAGAIMVVPIAPKESEAATRVLITAHKGSKAPLKLAAPFALHQADGSFTPQAEAIFRGEGALRLP